MDYRHLRYFIAVAEEQNITRAAERLHTVQPSLSSQIRRLEEIVGTPLFNRDKRRLELTEAGRIFLKEARTLLAGTDRAINLARSAARAEAGHVTVAFISGTETIIFPRFLPLFHAKCPHVELHLLTMRPPEQLQGLHEHSIDVGILGGFISDPEIESEVIVHQKIVAVLPAKHPIARSRRLSFEQLASLPIIRPSKEGGVGLCHWIDDMERKTAIHFQVACEVDSVLAALNGVAAGVGFSLLPDYVEELLPLRVTSRPLRLPTAPTLDLRVAYRKDNRLPALNSFLKLLRESIDCKQ
ncbi:MAG TPA: LysR substrate-binding domain-containing protein [Candidatus Nanoarchaeia archaeon]|nr:LysR substrate-binding domain-containing protein [Candidatus Nanoarchaeia archaeon]